MNRRTRELEWTGRWPRTFVMLMITINLMIGPVFTAAGGVNEPVPGRGLSPLLLGALIVGLVLYLVVFVADGRRPPAGPAIFVVLVLLVGGPIWWLGFSTNNWIPTIKAPAVAALLVFRGWRGIAIASIIMVIVASRFAIYVIEFQSWPSFLFSALNGVPGYFVGTLIIVGGALLLRTLNELHVARAELAELAISRERLRLSRDLHDLLGQSLSAVSLKADLAACLVDDRDIPGARAQTAELTAVARHALDGLGDVTSGRDAVSLREEIAGAAALLRAAEIDAGIDATELSLPGKVDAALAWSMREGVTNVLRHSAARSTEISVVRQDNLVRLEIVNDGVVGGPPEDGSGLAGLASRINELSGSVTAEFIEDDRFRLRVEVPLA
jgi:two-component system, NarL family, sensor histidine kinase DesK